MKYTASTAIRSILVTSLILLASPLAWAIQPSLTEIRAEADGTYTYEYSIKIDDTIRVEGRTVEPSPDFFTIFNFTGMVPGSEKQPKGWTFSTSQNGVTPFRGGRAVVSPLDIPGIPNLTWSRTGATIDGPAEISGFSVRTKIKESMVGEYGSQVTRTKAGTLKPMSEMEFKEARTGAVTTPKLN